jgi:CubicO group peptidase (beta-lactamase class C family)
VHLRPATSSCGLPRRPPAALALGVHAALAFSNLIHDGEDSPEVCFVRGSGDENIDHPTLVKVDAAEAGFDPAAFEELDAFVASRAGPGVSSPTRLFAGAVLLVAHRGRIIHESAVGYAQTHEGTQPLAEPREMTTDTIFDIASVTKVAATAAGVLKLVDEGVLSLESTLGEYLPELGPDKAPITLRQMLTHRSGLWEWQPTYLHGRDQADVLDSVAGVPLRYGIDTGRRYSDIGGGMLPGVMVERATGRRLDDYLRTEVHEPLGMTDTGFTPGAALRDRIAATSFGNPYEYRMIDTGTPYPVADTGRAAGFDGWRDYTLVGEVNDGNAWYGWKGVSGHAGLFSTARDLAVYGQTLNNGGAYGDVRLASAETVTSFLVEPSDRGQAIGFRSRQLPGVPNLPVSARGYGHGGFTGCEFLFDPSRGLVVVLLTNRQHPGEPYRSIASVWRGVLQRVLAALPADRVRSGRRAAAFR